MNLTSTKLFTAIFVLIASVLSAQTTYFVNALNGNNGNTGLSKYEAKQTIAAAISTADDGDIIRVSAGVYPESFAVNKALTIVGAGTGVNPLFATIITGTTSPVININANTATSGQKVKLRNLRVSKTTNGVAITIVSDNVSLEDIYAKGPNQQAIQINASVNNILLNGCEIAESNIGFLINDDINVNGLTITKTRFTGHRTHAVMFRESFANPAGMVQNVLFSNCLFENNNSTNINLGHAIYVEKLSNATFENISMRTPLSNTQNAFDINLKWRQDYENINFKNISIFRETPGVGIFVKGRDDAPLYNTPSIASITNVNIDACRFTGCRSNIRFENNVNDITITRCDLSNYDTTSGYGIVNITTSMATMNASNNYFGTSTPDLAVAAAAFSFANNPVITLYPGSNDELIEIGSYVFGQNLPQGTTVIAKNFNSITLSNAPTVGSTQDIFGFYPNPVLSSHVLTGAPCPLIWDNKLNHALVNNDNQSFDDLQTAVNSTAPNGSIFNLDPGFYTGSITIPHSLTLNSAGAAQLDPLSLPVFDVLQVNSQVELTLNNSITVETQLLVEGSLALNNQKLTINGKNEGNGLFKGSENAELQINGVDSLGVIRFGSDFNEIRSLSINRLNNGKVNLSSDLLVSNYITINEGIVESGDYSLISKQPEIEVGSNAYVKGNIGLGIESINSTIELNYPTGGKDGKREFRLTTVQGNPELTYYLAKMVDEPAYDLNNELPENINRVSPQRYWTLSKNGPSEVVSSKVRVAYESGDLVIDQDPSKLNLLKDEGNGNEIWTNLGGSANGIPNGFIESETNFTSFGNFSLGNVEGGFNLFADTVFVNGATGSNDFDGSTPVHVTGTNAGPKLTISAGFETVLPTGVVSIAAGNYQERAVLNKRISLHKSGSSAVLVDTIAFVNAVNLLPDFPSPTDFSVNTVDIGIGSKVADGFLLVGTDGVVYLRDIESNEVLSTAKSFTLKANNEFTLNSVTLTGAGNQLNFGTGFNFAGNLNLNGASGGKAKIFDFDLVFNTVNQIQGISSASYIITGGTGSVKISSVSGAAQFPIGTDNSFAPVSIENSVSNTYGMSSRVRAANLINSFNPTLPNTVNTFVKLQWTLSPEAASFSNARLTFEYTDADEENNFDQAPELTVGRAVSNFWSTLTPSLTQNNRIEVSGLGSVNGNYALFSKISVGIDDVNSTFQVFPNPANAQVTIRFTESFNGQLTITDLAGRVVLERNISADENQLMTFDSIVEWPQGLYLVKLYNANVNTTFRLIKQ